MAILNDFDGDGPLGRKAAPEQSAPMLVTAAEVCRMLKVSLRKLWRMRSARLLPMPLRLGASVRWRYDDIKNWIAAGCPAATKREK